MKNLFVILTATDEKVSPGIKVWILTSWSSKDKLKRREREERTRMEEKEKTEFSQKERRRENLHGKKEKRRILREKGKFSPAGLVPPDLIALSKLHLNHAKDVI